MEGPITKFKASKKMNSNIVGLILIGFTVVLAIVIVIAVIFIVKFLPGIVVAPVISGLILAASMYSTM